MTNTASTRISQPMTSNGIRSTSRIRSSRTRRKSAQRKRMVTLLLTIGIMIFSLLILSGFSPVGVKEKTSMQIRYEITTVKYDDTLWSIACRYYSDTSETINTYISEIMKLNNLHSDRIYAGQKLAVPCYY